MGHLAISQKIFCRCLLSSTWSAPVPYSNQGWDQHHQQKHDIINHAEAIVCHCSSLRKASPRPKKTICGIYQWPGLGYLGFITVLDAVRTDVCHGYICKRLIGRLKNTKRNTLPAMMPPQTNSLNSALKTPFARSLGGLAIHTFSQRAMEKIWRGEKLSVQISRINIVQHPELFYYNQRHLI